MPEVALVRTWKEIQEIVASRPDPLSVLRLVNSPSLSDWRFRMSFDENGKNVLHIQRTSPFTPESLVDLLSGKVPELLAGDSVVLRDSQGAELISIDLEQVRATPSANSIIELPATLPATIDEVVIVGFLGKSMFVEWQAHDKLRSYAYDRTSLGSEKYVALGCRVEWNCMGRATVLHRKSRFAAPKATGAPHFYTELHFEGEGSGSGFVVYLLTSPKLSNSIAFHSTYGRLCESDQALLTAATQFWPGHWLIEICSSDLSEGVTGRLVPTSHLRSTIDHLVQRMAHILAGREFQGHLELCERREIEEQARSLRDRQAQARLADYVYCQDELLMRVPRSENEVVALYMKLELKGALPVARLRCLEYTTQKGIDALGEYQRLPADAVLHLAPIEFEFKLENFFTHGHPASQVRLIVCWAYDGDGPTLPDGWVVHRYPGSAGIYWLGLGEYRIDLFVLSELEQIEILPWRD